MSKARNYIPRNDFEGLKVLPITPRPRGVTVHTSIGDVQIYCRDHPSTGWISFVGSQGQRLEGIQTIGKNQGFFRTIEDFRAAAFYARRHRTFIEACTMAYDLGPSGWWDEDCRAEFVPTPPPPEQGLLL